jgi:hypothetical protein
MSDETVRELWKVAPVVALLLAAFWAGHRGLWFWGQGVRLMISELTRERDEWRALALALLREKGVNVPELTSREQDRDRHEKRGPYAE